MHHDRESLGWLLGTWAQRIPLIMLLVGFGHSVLAMSGEESLAQVNREIEHPKLKNLEKTGLVIFLYSLFFTSLVSFFAVMIIPDHERHNYFANLIGGLAMNVVGPYTLAAGLPGLRGAGGRADPVGRGEHRHRGRQRRAEPDGGRRRPDHLVQEAAEEIRHQLSRDQHDRAAAGADHHRQPRQRLSAGFALCIRRDLELLVHVAGGAGAALYAAAEPRMEGAGEHPHSRRGDSGRTGHHLACAVLHRAGEPVHQGNGDHCRRELQPRVLHCVHRLRTRGARSSMPRASRAWSSSTSPPIPS